MTTIKVYGSPEDLLRIHADKFRRRGYDIEAAVHAAENYVRSLLAAGCEFVTTTTD